MAILGGMNKTVITQANIIIDENGNNVNKIMRYNYAGRESNGCLALNYTGELKYIGYGYIHSANGILQSRNEKEKFHFWQKQPKEDISDQIKEDTNKIVENNKTINPLEMDRVSLDLISSILKDNTCSVENKASIISDVIYVYVFDEYLNTRSVDILNKTLEDIKSLDLTILMDSFPSYIVRELEEEMESVFSFTYTVGNNVKLIKRS